MDAAWAAVGEAPPGVMLQRQATGGDVMGAPQMYGGPHMMPMMPPVPGPMMAMYGMPRMGMMMGGPMYGGPATVREPQWRGRW